MKNTRQLFWLPFTACLKLDINGHRPQCSFAVRHTVGTGSCYLLRGQGEDLVLTRICTKPGVGACQAHIRVKVSANSAHSCYSRVDRAERLAATLAAIRGPNLRSRMYKNVHYSLGAERLPSKIRFIHEP